MGNPFLASRGIAGLAVSQAQQYQVSADSAGHQDFQVQQFQASLAILVAGFLVTQASLGLLLVASQAIAGHPDLAAIQLLDILAILVL